MRSLTVAIALAAAALFATSLAGSVHATTATGPGGVTAPRPSLDVEPAGCRGPGAHCPPGRYWRCGPNRCWCAPC